MKLIVWLLVLVGLGWASVYFLGGYSSFDPDKQGRDAKAALSPGMTWQNAFEITGEPKKYQIINRHVQMINGVEVESFVPGPPMTFDRTRLAERLDEGSVAHGFRATFVYSNSTAFTVEFDGKGLVAAVEDAITVADLLDQRD